MMLECPGVFVAPMVPDGWTATGEPGEFYRLTPPSRDAAVRIQVHTRAPGPIREDDARGLVAAFSRETIGATGGEIRVVAARNEQRATTRLTHAGDDGRPVEWFVMCIVWPAAMLMCAYTGAPGDPKLADAERMLASIVPLGRRRWWPLRR